MTDVLQRKIEARLKRGDAPTAIAAELLVSWRTVNRVARLTAPSTLSTDDSGDAVMPGDVAAADRHVGQRLRKRRTALGLSQERLAEQLGISFQQIQKYEKGSNRVSMSRLGDIARVFGVAPEWFFKGLPQEDPPPGDPLITPTAQRLFEVYRRSDRPAQFVDLIESLTR